MTSSAALPAGRSAAGRPAPVASVKATREDWLGLAQSLLACDGIAAVTVLDLSERLGVSRSSFYWYFRNREELLDALLRRWESLNTRSIVQQAGAPAGSINEAICNVFRCWVDPRLYSPRLDSAVREWARRSKTVRLVLDRSDGERVSAIEAMFERHGYEHDEALARARVLYYTQIGYYALDIDEPMEARLKLAPHYLETFSGVAPRDEELAAFRAYALSHAGAADAARDGGDR